MSNGRNSFFFWRQNDDGDDDDPVELEEADADDDSDDVGNKIEALDTRDFCLRMFVCIVFHSWLTIGPKHSQ